MPDSEPLSLSLCLSLSLSGPLSHATVYYAPCPLPPCQAFDVNRNKGFYSTPVVSRGGWHLSSFGNASEFVRKVTTFGAANLFVENKGRDMFDEARIAACVHRCLGIIVKDGSPTRGRRAQKAPSRPPPEPPPPIPQDAP